MANQRCIFLALTIYSLVAFHTNSINAKVNNLQHFISTEKIEAEDYSSISGSYILYSDCSDPNVFYMGSLSQSTVIEYQQVDFLDGMNSVVIHVTNEDADPVALDVALHLGSYNNPPFLTVPVNYTGNDRCGFVTLVSDLDKTLTGVDDLYITFPSAQGGVLHLDWFVFNRTGSGSGFIATEKIEAEDFTSIYNSDIYSDCNDTSVTYVGDLYDYSTLVYDRVDFGSGVQMVTLRVSNSYAKEPMDISLHLGNSTNSPIATVPVGQTGSGRCDFFTLNAFLDTRPSGVQDLYLTFPSSQGGYLHLDWFVFNQTITQQ